MKTFVMSINVSRGGLPFPLGPLGISLGSVGLGIGVSLGLGGLSCITVDQSYAEQNTTIVRRHLTNHSTRYYSMDAIRPIIAVVIDG